MKMKVAVLGRGGMGKLFARVIAMPKKFEIDFYGRDVKVDELKVYDIMVIATPGSAAADVERMLRQLPEGTLVICLWSYMGVGEETFKELRLPIVYIHLLFGPDIEDLVQQNIVLAGEYKHKKFALIEEKLKMSGARLNYASVTEHDKMMAYTQSMSQLTSIMLGISLARSGYSPQKLDNFASLTFRLNRYTIERIMRQKAALWAELQFENKFYPNVLEQYKADLENMIAAIKARDEEAFTLLFNDAALFWSAKDEAPDPDDFAQPEESESGNLVALGPEGTYSHQAALEYDSGADIVLASSITEVITAVADEGVPRGIIPVENSIQGVVAESFDGLFTHKLTITDEVVLDINHALCALEPPQRKDLIKIVYSHPQALAQCREYLRQEYPNAQVIPTVSTAAAMQIIADQKAFNALAIGPKFAARLYGLTVIDEGIQDMKGNQTRFAVFTKEVTKGSNTAFTQIVIMPQEDRPGLLSDILNIIRDQKVNISQIESRPDKTKLGSYIFYIRLDVASNNKAVEAIINQLHAINVKTRKLTP